MASSLQGKLRNIRNYDEDYEHESLIDTPYVGSYYGDDGDLYYGPGYQNYRNRQFYLNSYKFTRERTLSDRLKSSLSKFKAAAWAVMACNYKPVLARKIKQTFHCTAHCLRSGASHLHLPKCLRVSG